MGRRPRRPGTRVVFVPALVIAALLLVLPPHPVLAQRDWLDRLAVGRLLVADANLTDRHFARTVVLLLSYSNESAAGLILNQQTTLPVRRVVPDLSAPRGAASMVFLGGPVSVPDVRALVRTPAAPAGALRVLDDIYFLSTSASLDQAIERGIDPSRIRLYAGYAGWGAGQLDRELRRGDWHVLDGTSDLVFDADPVTLWRRAIRLTDVVVL